MPCMRIRHYLLGMRHALQGMPSAHHLSHLSSLFSSLSLTISLNISLIYLVTSAPFLASSTLKQRASNYQSRARMCSAR